MAQEEEIKKVAKEEGLDTERSSTPPRMTYLLIQIRISETTGAML